MSELMDALGTLAQPAVLNVGRLGDAYWSWVDRPVKGHPRFFGPSWLEHLTKTPWWLVPCLWAPLHLACAAHAHMKYAWPLPHLLGLLVVGVLLWQLLEYLIHRFAFHAHVSSYWGITLHFLFHGCHHKYPMDSLRLVMPPLPALAAHMIVYAALFTAFPPHIALPLFAGAGMGYVAYDCLHYAIHYCKGGRSAPPLLFFLPSLRGKHLHHHFRDSHSDYGISSPLFDYVFQTSSS